jgi:hypothetical protein
MYDYDEFTFTYPLAETGKTLDIFFSVYFEDNKKTLPTPIKCSVQDVVCSETGEEFITDGLFVVSGFGFEKKIIPLKTDIKKNGVSIWEARFLKHLKSFN